jgi:hypothetical protein
MPDNIALGLSVDSSGVVEGTRNLNTLAGAAQAAAKASQELTGATSGASSAAAAASQATGAAATAFSTSGAASAAFAVSMTGAAAATVNYTTATVKATAATQASTSSLNAQTSAANNNASASSKAAAAANTLSAATKGVGSQAGIVGAQFQDIAVQLAGGQSPFLIALQQGTQLSFLLEMLAARGIGVGQALAGAFAFILSPIGIATVAVIALGGYLIQYFTQAQDKVDKTNALFEKHAQLIQSVAREWGDAVPELKRYADELERTVNLQKLQDAAKDKRSEVVTQVSGAFNTLADNQPGIINLLSSASVQPKSQLHELGVAMESLQDKVNNGTVTFEDFSKARDIATKTAVTTGRDDIKDFANEFGRLVYNVQAALEKLGLFEDQVKKITNPSFLQTQDKIQSLTSGQIKEDQFNFDNRTSKDFLPSNNIPVPTRRPSDFDKEEEEVKGLKKAYGDEASAINEATKAYNSLVQAQNNSLQRLSLEANLIGASAQERAVAIARLDAEQKARQANVGITQQQIDKLKDEAAAQAQLKLKVDQMTAGWKTVQDAGMSAIDQLTASIGDLDTSAKQLALNLVNTLLDPLKELAIANPLKNAIYGTNLPTMESIGGFSGFFDALSGKKAPPLAAMPSSTTGTMTVTAGVVTVNGPMAGTTPGLGGLANVLGGDHLPVNGVRPDVVNGQVVNSPIATANNVARILPAANQNIPAGATPLSLQNTPHVPTSADLTMYQQAISKIESGSFAGNYNTLGPTLKNGDYAIGRYQIMANNVPSWSQKYLGSQMTPSQLRADPNAQDAIFNGEFGSYVSKYGASGASSKWFTGSPYPSGKADVLGTTDNSYVKQFQTNLTKLGDISNSTASNMTTLNKDTGSLSSGFSNLFQNLGAAPSSSTSSGGGFFSFLGSLFGGSSAPTKAAPASVAQQSLRAAPTDASRASASSKQKLDLQVHTTVDKKGNLRTFVQQVSRDTVSEDVPKHIDAYDKQALPGRVKQISNDEYANG